MSKQEQPDLYDIQPNDTRWQLSKTVFLSVANVALIGLAHNLVQMDTELGSITVKMVVGAHFLQLANAGLQVIRDLRTPDIQPPENGEMVRGWRKRLATRNLIFNVAPLFVSLGTLSALYAGNSVPTPLPTPGGVIQA